MAMYDDWSSMSWGGKVMNVSVVVTGYLTLAGWVAEEAAMAESHNTDFLHCGGGIVVKTSKRPRADGKTYYTVEHVGGKDYAYIGTSIDEAKKAIASTPRVPKEYTIDVLHKYVTRQWSEEVPPPPQIKLAVCLDNIPSSKWEATYVAQAEAEIAKAK